MLIWLTGATGFIGSQVARELLRRGHEVNAPIRPSSTLERVAGLPIRFLEIPIHEVPSDSEMVIHLAWITTPGKYLEDKVNDECLWDSLRLLEKSQVRVVSSGTCFEFDTSKGRLTEDSPTLPTSRYAKCKDILRQAVIRRSKCLWMRFFYQYGPYEDPKRFVSGIIRSLLRGEDVKLSPGAQKRDYLHVEDVATAVCDVAESDLTGCVNVGSGSAVSTGDLAMKLAAMAGRESLVKLGAVPYWQGEPMLIEADNSKLSGTGWKPKYTLESGLQKTFEWWKSRS